MPENSSAVEQSRNDRKAPGRYNWRAKLFESYRSKGQDKQQDVGLATDVTDFLNGTISNTSPELQIGLSTPLHDVSTAPVWQSAAGAPRSGKEAASQTEGPLQQSTRTNSASALNPAKNKGLHVRFIDEAPVIIGEGGDEADLAPKDILRARSRLEQAHGKHRSNAERDKVKVENWPHGKLPKQSDHVAHEFLKDSDPVSLQATPTRIITSEHRQQAKVPQEENGSAINEKDSSVMTLNEDDKDVGVLPSHSPNLKAIANAAQSMAGAEDGQEVHLDAQRSSRVLDNQAIKHGKDNPISKPPLATRGYSLSDINSIVNHSSSTTPSLQPQSQPQANSFGTHVPASNVPRGSPQPNGGSAMFQDAMQHSDPSIEGMPKVTPLSLRAVAHAVVSDALDEFAARVQHYDGSFRSTAAADRPGTDIAFVEWIRAATWWFLKGRGDLESAIRSRPRGADSTRNARDSSSLADISQAYVNLAKAWWILRGMTPEHPNLIHYGNAGMKSTAAIMRSLKKEELAEAVETHLGLVASMRALTMSMKRNHLLPPNPESDSQPAGLDMRIWSTPRPLPSYLSPLLSSCLSQGPTHIPIGDTTDSFCYATMFVHMDVTIQSDSGEAKRLPCVLSVVREPTHWQMHAILVSQDEQISLVIQSDRSAGLTWGDVEWKAPKWQLQLRLPGRIEVQVQLKEHDYSNLCRLHTHNHKVMRSFEPEAPQEVLLFETTLRKFVRLDPRRSKQFPSDAIMRCRLQLFEKNVTRVEATGLREVHQGYRLNVVTPPNMKTLSIIESRLSCKQPVIFSYLRGEEGAPALLLKLSNGVEYSADTSFSVVMTFDEAAQRAEMHSLLNGTTARNSESTIATLMLNNLSIKTRPPAGHTTKGSETLPPGLHWDRMQIINGSSRHTPHGHNRTVLSESLRLCVASPMGTMTDRINSSQCTIAPSDICADIEQAMGSYNCILASRNSMTLHSYDFHRKI